MIPILKFLSNPLSSDMRQDIIGREEGEDFLVDTCLTGDTGKYETDVSNKQGSAVVEIYKSREDSIEGHKKWVKYVKKNPDFKPKEVGMANWLGLE